MPSSAASRLPLIALAIAAFAIGTTEFVIMGLLPQIAADLSVSIPSAGRLVSGYAIGVVVGGPLLVLATLRLPQRRALLLLMGLFVIGNLACALAPNYALLMLARFVAAFSHGSFFGVASVVAMRVVAADARAQAVAQMFAGLTIANIVGVPLGAWLGEACGWRATFAAVAALGLIALIAMARWIPRLAGEQAANLRAELTVMRRPSVWLALGMTVFGFGGVFTVFTFVVPILREVSGIAAVAVPAVLMIFGAGATIGTLCGGRLADWKLMPALLCILAALILLYALLPLVLPQAAAAVVGVFLVGLLGFGAGPGLQTRCMQQAEGAPLLASALNQSAFNLGNAGGAFIGASLLDAGADYAALPWAAAAITAVGFLLAAASAYRWRPPLTGIDTPVM